MTQNRSFIHRFEPGTRLEAPPLLLLHGTGGDENDLLPLGRAVSPGSALLSVRGQVLEHGMPRFFRRLAEGVFDEDDVVRRAHELADFVEDARKQYGIAAPIALGYSNGANIAAAMLLLRPSVLAGGLLVRAMVPLSRPPEADLAGRPVLILSGLRDPIISSENGETLAAMLHNAGADVDRRVVPVGHELSQTDLLLAQQWMAERSVPAPHEA
ncbi:phospholipase/carboxylesterase [Nitrobacteraceae bacterium AZCC 1564]